MKNAIWKKEMQLSVRKKKTAIGMLVFNLLLIGCTLFGYHVLFEQKQTFTYVNYSLMTNLYVLIMAVEMGLVAFIVPAITAGSIVGEREKQTLDILFTTSLSSKNIVWGKLVSSVSTLMLYLISALPVLFIIFAVGGVRMWHVVVSILYIFVVAIYIGSIGIFFSTCFKKSVVATVWTYGMVIFTTVGTHFLLAVSAILNIHPLLEVMIPLNLFSPLANATNLLSSQSGNAGIFWSEWYFDYSTFWSENMSEEIWFVLSIVVQIITAAVLLFFAARRLNPVKKGKKHTDKR